MSAAAVTADPHRCLGSGQCVLLAPEVFTQSPADGTVRVLVDRPQAQRLAAVAEAVAQCPVQALTLHHASAPGVGSAS